MLWLIVAIYCVFFFSLLAAWATMIRMPGRSYRGPLPPPTEEEQTLAQQIEKHLHMLTVQIGERNLARYEQLVRAAEYIETSLAQMGYAVHRQEYQVDGRIVWNIWAETTGRQAAEEIIVLGSHYDTVPGCPGANDNGSAVAANLELARAFSGKPLARTLRFVFFVNEEGPYFMTPAMGSIVYADACAKRGENIVGMLSLETIGCYFQQPSTQNYPPPLRYFYPTTGDFVAFVGNFASRRWVRAVVGTFRRNARFPSQGIAATELLRDIGRSDHRAFWQAGYPALMVTDTANFRYPEFHQPTDTMEHLNLDALSRVVAGLRRVIEDLAGDRYPPGKDQAARRVFFSL